MKKTQVKEKLRKVYKEYFDGLYYKNDASFVKTSLIDFWLKNYTADLIANEVPFFKGNRRADLIMISNNNLLGFEIKSELDSLKNLKSQILDYKKF